jgi:hypothetical protein
MADIPDILFGLGPIGNMLFNRDVPEVPNLSDAGIEKEDISRFFNLRRSIARAGVHRQGATAARTAAANLPAALRQSTVPASIAAGVQTKIADQIAGMEGEFAGEEMNARFQLFDAMMNQFQGELAASDRRRSSTSGALEAFSFIPLIL